MKLYDLKTQTDYFEFDKNLYSLENAIALKDIRLVSFNKSACDLIGLDYSECQKNEFLDFMNGKKHLQNSKPYSMAYSGHQFGSFTPKLGDGRVLNLGSINSWHLQTKGSGLTKYSRRGDGKAILSSSIREYLMSEHLHALGIPTTRALAIVDSNTFAARQWEEQSCAIVLRLSSSWVRIGHFEYFARTKDALRNVKQLGDYVIKNSYPHLINHERKYEKFFYELIDNSAYLLALWQAYGFMHGVMNTDNFSVCSLTIDYGPYAFMNNFEKDYICNKSDVEGRYSYSNQPYVARWNLAVLANSLSCICDSNKLEESLHTFIPKYEAEYLKLMYKKIGFDENINYNENLIYSLLDAMQYSKIDYNVFFYKLFKLNSFDDLNSLLDICIYKEPLNKWLKQYKQFCEEENISFEIRQKVMKKVNPKYILKNYIIDEAIKKAHEGDYSLVNDLLYIGQNPYLEHEKFERYAKSTPQEFTNLKMSCSS